jgi:invasion protein IalB
MKKLSTANLPTVILAAAVLFSCSWVITQAQAADQNAADTNSPATAAAPADGVHGSWQQVCPAPEPCRIAQSIVLKDSQQPIVVARFYRSKAAAAVAEPPPEPVKTKGKKKAAEKAKAAPKPVDGPGAVGVFTMPLGIFLAPGFALKVDDKAVRRFAYENCDVEGCHLGIQVDAALLGELSSGKVATVQFYDAAQKPVVLNLSLDGFAPAFEGLK